MPPLLTCPPFVFDRSFEQSKGGLGWVGLCVGGGGGTRSDVPVVPRTAKIRLVRREDAHAGHPLFVFDARQREIDKNALLGTDSTLSSGSLGSRDTIGCFRRMITHVGALPSGDDTLGVI